ncbi:MAG: LemA family protein [Rickettsiales bacterium]|jgi:LemA protein|nr:LemA family protein [Rickettsiales bacterium]
MWITIAVIAVILLYIVAVYNGLVARRTQAKEAWATVDTQLKRRYDLIPNLVNAVGGAAAHESKTLEAVINARNSAISAKGIEDKAAAENQLTGALKSIFALSESYPTLQANQNFLELQRELSDTETKIQAARQFYNTVVMGLNTAIAQFPSNIIANLFKISAEEFFKIDDAEKITPKVEF